MEGVRLDTWLDIACLFKTRSQAARAIRLGRVTLDGTSVKPHNPVRPGATIRISTGDRPRVILIREVVDRHVPRSRARELYEDITPQVSPEEREMAERDRAVRPRFHGRGRPSSRDRSRMRRVKEKLRE